MGQRGSGDSAPRFISAVAGAIITVLMTCLYSRKRIAYLMWFVDAWMPVTRSSGANKEKLRIQYGEKSVAELWWLHLRFANKSDHLISEAMLTVQLSPTCSILEGHAVKRKEGAPESVAQSAASFHILPDSSNVATVALFTMFPYQIDPSAVDLDIICDGEVENVNVSGNGVTPDGTLWTVERTWYPDFRPLRYHRRINTLGAVGFFTHLLSILLGFILYGRINWVGRILDGLLVTATLRDPVFILLVLWTVALPVWTIIYWTKLDRYGRREFPSHVTRL